MSLNEPRYINTRQAARYLGLSPFTLNRMRGTGEGPRYAKAGRRVIYDRTDLEAWINERKRNFTRDCRTSSSERVTTITHNKL